MTYVEMAALLGWLVVLVQNARRIAEFIVDTVRWAKGLGKR